MRPNAARTEFDGPLEGSPLAVHPVDDDQAGKAVLLGVAPHLLGLDLDTRHGVDDDDGRVGDAKGEAGFEEKVAVSRGVDDVDLGLSPFGERDGGLEADLAFDLVCVEVRDRRPVFHPVRAGSRLLP